MIFHAFDTFHLLCWVALAAVNQKNFFDQVFKLAVMTVAVSFPF